MEELIFIPEMLTVQKVLKPINNDNQAGFTIIESLVVVFILVLGLLPVLSGVVSSLDISSNIKNTYIASNLVQEGLEVVRGIRDKQWLEDPDPDPPYSFGGLAGVWRVQWDSDTLISIGTNPFLKIDSNGLYNYNSGEGTLFKRIITIEDINADPADPDTEEMRIISEVTWVTRRGITRSLKAESHLYNWY